MSSVWVLVSCRLRGPPADRRLPAEEEPPGPVLDHLPGQKVQLKTLAVTTATSCHHTALPNSSSSSSFLSCDWSMEVLLRRWRLRCVHINLESFGADGPEVGGSTLPGRHSIQMMVITVEEEEEESC